MRTKPCARHVSRVMDLSLQNHAVVQNREQWQPPSDQLQMTSVQLPLPVESSATVVGTLRQQRKRKTASSTEVNGQQPAPRVYRKRTKDGKGLKDESGPSASITTTNVPLTPLVQNGANGGLCRVDFGRLVEGNLLNLQRCEPVYNGVGARSVPMMEPRPAFGHADHHTLAIWRQLMLTSIAMQGHPQLRMQALLSHPVNPVPVPRTTGERFSIFRSVELMAQSSSSRSRKI